MYKALLLSAFLLITFLSCQKDNTTGSIHFESETPVWLQAKINNISADQDYYGAEVYRYEWDGKLIYHIIQPLSSCAFCELYYHNGNKAQLSGDEFSDFIENKKNRVFIWEWYDV